MRKYELEKQLAALQRELFRLEKLFDEYERAKPTLIKFKLQTKLRLPRNMVHRPRLGFWPVYAFWHSVNRLQQILFKFLLRLL